MLIDNSNTIAISPFSFKGEICPSIDANPVTFFDGTIDFIVSDKDPVENFVMDVSSGFQLIDKTSHKGIHIRWILLSICKITRLCWPLLICKISISC